MASSLLRLWDNASCRRVLHGRGALLVGCFVGLFLGCHYLISYSVVPEDFLSPVAHRAVTGVAVLVLVFYVVTTLSSPGEVKFSRDETDAIMESGRKAMVCRTCAIIRPVRSKHCPICGICVAKFDHHCVWTNGCIGYRNIGFFYTFLSLLALDLCLSACLCASNLHSTAANAEPLINSQFAEPDPLDDAAFANTGARAAGVTDEELASLVVPPPSVLSLTALSMLVVCIAGVAFVVPLCLVHSHQIATDLTTNEAINASRYPYLHEKGRFKNPFDRGFCQNAATVVCSALYCDRAGDVDWSTVDLFTVSEVRNFARHQQHRRGRAGSVRQSR